MKYFKIPTAGLVLLLAATNPSLGAFSQNFQTDTIGSPPSGWSPLFGTNGSTATFNVDVEGANKFAALRDLNDSTSIQAYRLGSGFPEASGYLEVDVRLNLVSTGEVKVSAYNAATSQELFDLTWFRPFNNAGNGIKFRSKGDNQFTDISTDFPTGTWQSIRVEFSSIGGGNGNGAYSVIWNGTTNDFNFNHNYSPGIEVGALVIQTTDNPLSISSADFDNFVFIPEPSALALTTLVCVVLGCWRRKLATE